MSPKLKPLLLPQLVEERKRMEVYQQFDMDDDRQYVYYTHNSSSSDITSPVTPTFSAKGHLRCSSSTSSLDVPIMLDTPASPCTPSAPVPSLTPAPALVSSKRQLPDVEEEPAERDDQDTVVSDQFDLYDCLCDDPCVHPDGGDMILTGYGGDDDGIDYDYGFTSDFTNASQMMAAKRKGELYGLATRVSTRLSNLSRWKSSKRSVSQIRSPTTDVSFERTLYLTSPTASSRSSSLSLHSRRRPADRSSEPPLPTGAARAFWASDEDIAAPPCLTVDPDGEDDESGRLKGTSLERERALAATPLLPPLLTGVAKEGPQESPLQSPSVAPSTSGLPEVPSFPAASREPSQAPTPGLSTVPSYSSLRPFQDEQQQAQPEAVVQQQQQQQSAATAPVFMQEMDEWSDRLGHANFTIQPQPYLPEEAAPDSLQQLVADWEAARINYTKHIVRTGENYGQTSKIYALTEAKWAEIDGAWREAHETTLRRVPSLAQAASKTEEPVPSFVPVRSTSAHHRASRSRSRGRARGRSRAGSASVVAMPPSMTPAAAMLPQLVDAQGKFPERGDEDIVGPMVREACMAADMGDDRRNRFWKQLADKVGLRR
ncbi:hypothetical protein SODALDRAFT_272836 [Sodiomyces alkalinus F11]|uniref:Only prolin and serin are matching in the corresponding protein n=1 Tax=Sodiomyces alkalinus (strain CBS 110278 / VKM F-3762 / F11) TaxID=1314773 RepID=A0A3N2Q0Z7_SODAK|nr:hypothetical protein SODALDRAFT_272836 [Sodiomyces alkalinus F11]ROT40431.1 hypothetical protein SODALDRAFT_272836 [Sodiomyces alkalinus F11]